MMKKMLIAVLCLLMLLLPACKSAEQTPTTNAPTQAATQEPTQTTTEATEPTEPVILNWKTNLLRSDEVSYQSEYFWEWADEAANYPVFGSEYTRAQIRSVTFVNSLSQAPSDAWDVSAKGNYAVMAWVEPEGPRYNLYIGADGGINAGAACVDLFAG